ncbi:MAG: DUF2330 domain-containing protein, partial [Myxococcales bacterium]|nr:DUF2330 domain-containing protein [Myxococcales bacterium]
MRSFGWTTAIVGLGAAIALETPTPAHACGGTFCDAGPIVTDPEAMPVDQTGETIVFAVDDTHVEAHIQIDYDPQSGAERFAWLIPIMGQNPEFEVGSQQLLLNLQNSTVPSYGYVNQQESCGGFGGSGDWDGDWGGDWDGCDGGSTGGASPGDGYATSGADDTGGDDGGTTGGETEVVSKATVGAFDIVVLQSQTAEDLMLWLGDNEFFEDPQAQPILQEYIDEGAMFAAIRLDNEADVGEIHPIVMRYEGSEPCVPIRLTRIAAQDDMAIRAFFLADGRTYPTNYRHVALNPIELDWIGLADNYLEVVTMAVDSPSVDGHGFVTEYAGSTETIVRDGIFDARWEELELGPQSPVDLADQLETIGLMSCAGLSCTYTHPLLEGLLATYLPVPEGVDPDSFYRCLECYEDLIDLEAWDPDLFARDYKARIIDPGRHAEELLGSHGFVTRLFTTISPHEMTLDPTFHVEPEDLSTVDDRAIAATRYFPCGSTVQMQGLPGNRSVRLPVFDQWPEIFPDQMPWVETVTEHPIGAAPVVLVDNTALIDELLAAWNASLSTRVAASCAPQE